MSSWMIGLSSQGRSSSVVLSHCTASETVVQPLCVFVWRLQRHLLWLNHCLNKGCRSCLHARSSHLFLMVRWRALNRLWTYHRAVGSHNISSVARDVLRTTWTAKFYSSQPLWWSQGILKVVLLFTYTHVDSNLLFCYSGCVDEDCVDVVY